jgi:hypothetical protein
MKKVINDQVCWDFVKGNKKDLGPDNFYGNFMREYNKAPTKQDIDWYELFMKANRHYLKSLLTTGK